MTYSQGGVVQAADYNGLVSGTNQLNTVWGVGTGDAGYGQTPVSTTVAAGGATAATEWTTLINTVNSVARHQTNNGTNLGARTAGSVIAATGLAGNINTFYTNRNTFGTQGTTLTGTVFTNSATAATGVAYGESTVLFRYVTFSSGDAARYFFNCGGQLNFIVTNVTNNDATARSTDARTLILTNLASVSAFRNGSNAGPGGTGGTLNINTTAFGYNNLTTSWTNTVQITSTTAPYTTDYVKAFFISNTQNSSGHGDKGSQVGFAINLYSPAHSAFNGSLNITVSTRVDVVYPETTYLTNVWGTPTIT